MSEGKERNINIGSGSAGGFYFMGFIGSAIYYVSNATDFWVGVLGLFKSLVWPAFLVYNGFLALHV